MYTKINQTRFFYLYGMRMKIVKMACVYGERDNILSPTMKWTGPMLYKKRLTADRIISQKEVNIKGRLGLIKPEGVRCLPP